MAGALEKIVEHELEMRRLSEEAAARKAPVEAARFRKRQAEIHAEARRAAMQEAEHLLGRVIFPARWTVTEGERYWLALTAAFEGKIELRFFWHPRQDQINEMKVRPLRMPPGFDKWPELSNVTRQSLADALLKWGLC